MWDYESSRTACSVRDKDLVAVYASQRKKLYKIRKSLEASYQGIFRVKSIQATWFRRLRCRVVLELY